jgi:CDP-6-deoxy-D-xylo-4-hexulose-3-dehydrase
MFYELAVSTWGPEERDAVNQVIAVGRLTMGDQVGRFETAFASRFGMKHAVMVNSGSSANLVAIAALCYKQDRPLRRGDEAIVPAISWATTFHPLQQYGLRLRFVDVELDTLNMDVSRLEAALTPRTRIVVAVSVLGNPAALDVIRAFCDRNRLYLLEDNCESIGASLNGRPCGTFGHLNTFSTFFSHQMSTMEGGMVLTDDDELASLARVIRNHGWNQEPPDSPPPDGFVEAYRFVLPGYNLRPLELSGAVGLVQLQKLDAMIERRRANAAQFFARFQGDERFRLQREHGCSSWFAFTLVLNASLGIDRSRVLHALREAGIGFRMITGGCFPRHEAIRFFDYDTVGPLTNANLAHDHGFFVGNHPRDLTAEIARFHEVLDRAAQPVRSAIAR